MGTLGPVATTWNGGFTSLGRKTIDYRIRGAIPEVTTRAITVASGQVLKAMTWLESDSSGNMIAHSPMPEIATVVFVDIAAAATMILAGLTWTAGGSGTTAEELAIAFADIPVGEAYNGTLLAARTTGGSFTAGTLAGYDTHAENATTVVFEASTIGAATDVSAGGTGTAPTITIVQYAVENPIVGLLAMDVDATSAATDAQMYTGGNFWSDAIVWNVDPTVDTITGADGTAVACTTYNTGCYDEIMKQKFLESTAGGTNFAIGNFKDGEVEV